MSQDAPSPQAALLDYLNATIVDGRMSDAERRTLTELLREAVPPEESLRRARNRAFQMAREQLASGAEAQAALNWLEGAMRAIDGARQPVETVRNEACFSPGDACRRTIVQQLRAAREHIDICVFTLSDDHISDEVLASFQRGVRLRIITDNDKEFDEGSDVARLRAAGIPLRVDRTSAHMHHKFALVDGRCLLNGSYNWTRSAALYNEENLVLSTEPALVQRFAAHFERMWASLA